MRHAPANAHRPAAPSPSPQPQATDSSTSKGSHTSATCSDRSAGEQTCAAQARRDSVGEPRARLGPHTPVTPGGERTASPRARQRPLAPARKPHSIRPLQGCEELQGHLRSKSRITKQPGRYNQPATRVTNPCPNMQARACDAPSQPCIAGALGTSRDKCIHRLQRNKPAGPITAVS